MIKICLILDSDNICKWHHDLIHHITSSGNSGISSFIHLKNTSARSSISWRCFAGISGLKRGLSGNLPLTVMLKNIPGLSFESTSSLICLSEADPAFFQSHPADILLNLSSKYINPADFNNFPGKIWQFRNFRLGKDGFSPEIFSDVLHKSKYTTISLTESTSDQVSVLEKTRFKIYPFSYKKTITSILKDLHLPVIKALKSKNGVIPGGLVLNQEPGERPDFRDIAGFLFNQSTSLLRHVWERGFFVDHWNLGYTDKPIHSFLNPDATHHITWFKSDRRRFVADCFAIEKNGQKYVFLEGLDYSDGKGYLSAALFKNNRLENEQVILKEPFHLSYPFVFEYGNEFYCIPETNEAGCIMLYRAEEFPYKWKRDSVLVAGFKGIDTTVFQHEGKWWMFSSEKDNGPYHKLNLFYSENLRGPWKEHIQNPVKIDITATRGAGAVFTHQGKLYRPAQDYSEKIEGRMRICEIEKLSPDEFSEREVTIVNPFTGSAFGDKAHTLAPLGDITIVDGCKQVFIFSDPAIAWFKISRLLKQILKKFIPGKTNPGVQINNQ